VQKIHELVGELSTVIHAPERSTLEAGRVLNMITGIAEQMNLLALNASLEAVRVGGQGREVTALMGEIQELASRSARVATEIGIFIQKVKQETSPVAGNGSSAAGENLVFTLETRQQFNIIVQHVENVVRQVGRVASLAVEIGTGHEETVSAEEKTA
jgi:methyl-accepting chemotaxis protein